MNTYEINEYGGPRIKTQQHIIKCIYCYDCWIVDYI